MMPTDMFDMMGDNVCARISAQKVDACVIVTIRHAGWRVQEPRMAEFLLKERRHKYEMKKSSMTIEKVKGNGVDNQTHLRSWVLKWMKSFWEVLLKIIIRGLKHTRGDT